MKKYAVCVFLLFFGISAGVASNLLVMHLSARGIILGVGLAFSVIMTDSWNSMRNHEWKKYGVMSVIIISVITGMVTGVAMNLASCIYPDLNKLSPGTNETIYFSMMYCVFTGILFFLIKSPFIYIPLLLLEGAILASLRFFIVGEIFEINFHPVLNGIISGGFFMLIFSVGIFLLDKYRVGELLKEKALNAEDCVSPKDRC